MSAHHAVIFAIAQLSCNSSYLHSLINYDSCPTRRMAAGPIPEGKTIIEKKIIFWIVSLLQYYDFDRTTVALFKNIFNKSLQKNDVIPLVVGPRYLFFAHRSE